MPSSRLHPWIEGCQRFASTLIDADGPTACRAFVELAVTAPRQVGGRERAIVRRILGEAWTRLLMLLTAAGDERSDRAAADGRVCRALSAIESRFADPRFRLRTLARELGVSSTHLTQLLKRDTGGTFGSHLHARRISEARLLLLQGTLSIKEIAARVGYTSSSQLDRHFKRRIRCAPSAFRDRQGRNAAASRVAGGVVSNFAPTQTATLPQK